MGKRIISISVWGDNSKYTAGVIENIKLQKVHYPDWKMRIFVAENVPKAMVEAYEMMQCEVVRKPGNGEKDGLFWRFEPIFDLNIERFIVRDADARLSAREAAAVKEWIESGLPFHVMRDNQSHATAVMGGMWGAVAGCVPNFKALMEDFLANLTPNKYDTNPRGPYFNTDQQFLAMHIWPQVKLRACAHDEFHSFTGMERKFPTPREGTHFVGEG